MASPTARANEVWEVNGGDDLLQLNSRTGGNLGGINSIGAGFGALAGLISPFSAVATPSNVTTPILLSDGVEQAINVSDPINIPVGFHKVLILGSFLNVFLGSGTRLTSVIRRGPDITGTVVSEFAYDAFGTFSIGQNTSLSPIAVDILSGPITGQQYTLSAKVQGAGSEVIANSIAVIILT